nr:MG2 domain-containing protein [Armatimonadota bacterium]
MPASLVAMSLRAIWEPGAYLVEADGENGRERGATLVLVSDLAVVKKTDKDAALCFVADARSGQPVAGATVVVRETYEENNHNHVQISRGRTDADGLFSAPRVRRPNVYSANVEALAWAPGHRYALTNAGYANWYDDGSDNGNRDEIKAYAYTDRPVYRPKQTVSFRDLLAKRQGGGSDFAPLVGVPVTVTVNSPKGEEIYKTTVTSSRFGSVSGSFPLPSGAPLGEYIVSVTVPQANGSVTDAGGNRFRVEEYKKPEYEVKVTPSTTQARFGDKVTATVSATLYSGPPVAGAKVAYKVFRNPYSPQYHFPQPYDWYYRNWDNGDYANQNADQGEIVTQGEGVTDAQGNLRVTFVADKGARGYDGDYAYTVKADVTDTSRRQISGEGIVKVSHQSFYAYLNVPNGFYHRGDTAQIELRTQDANAQSVSATGLLTVSRVTYATGGKEVLTPVFTQTVTTDADGKAFTTWRSEQSGQYRAEWAGTDKNEQRVLAQAPVWVEGDDLNSRSFRVGGVTVLTDKT